MDSKKVSEGRVGQERLLVILLIRLLELSCNQGRRENGPPKAGRTVTFVLNRKVTSLNREVDTQVSSNYQEMKF